MGRGTENTMAEKKSLKTILAKSAKAFNSIFHKKKDGKQAKETQNKEPEQNELEQVTNKLGAIKIEPKEKENNDDELFTRTVVNDPYKPARDAIKNLRSESQSSGSTVDSGYDEKDDDDKRDENDQNDGQENKKVGQDDEKDVIISLNALTIDEKKDKAEKNKKDEKNKVLRPVARTPIRTQHKSSVQAPYSIGDNRNRQLTHHSGGGVIKDIAPNLLPPLPALEAQTDLFGDFTVPYNPELFTSCDLDQELSENIEEVCNNLQDFLSVINPSDCEKIYNAVDYIQVEQIQPESYNANSITVPTEWYGQPQSLQHQGIPDNQFQLVPEQSSFYGLSASGNMYSPGPIESPQPDPFPITGTELLQQFDTDNLLSIPDTNTEFIGGFCNFETPPRSDNGGSSPLFLQHNTTDYSPQSDFSLSPLALENTDISCMLSPETSGHEDAAGSPERCERKLPQYKKMKEAIVSDLQKKYGDSKRESSRVLFAEMTKDLKPEERIALCKKLSVLSIETVAKILVYVLYNLSSKNVVVAGLMKDEKGPQVQYYLYVHICNMILDKEPEWFLGVQGLHLLAAASLWCSDKPLLLRYAIECTRVAEKGDPGLLASSTRVFSEVDRNGDSLIMALVRRGDSCADVLYEIVRCEKGHVPLFDINYRNPEGYSALHVACMMEEPSLQVVHVLIAHANADVKLGDVKGNDIALHLAVNKANCSLDLVLLLFSNTKQDEWHTLSKRKNLSNKTPLEYANVIAKNAGSSKTSKEVLNFLKRIRPPQSMKN